MKSSKDTLGIGAIFKDEAPFILEWLAHHRLLGIRHFFIADNISSDGTSELLQALAQAGYLVVHQFPTDALPNVQTAAYEMLVKEHAADVEWMALIDADEFIWPEDGLRSLPDFVQEHSARHPDAGAIVLNWAVYGSSRQLYWKDDLVVNRFTWRSDREHFVNKHVKSIVRTDCVDHLTCGHNAALVPGKQALHTDGVPKQPEPSVQNIPLSRHALSAHLTWSGFRLNHYVIKSYEEYVQKKVRRGRAQPFGHFDSNFFTHHDINTVDERPDAAYVGALRSEIRRIEESLKPFLAEIPRYQPISLDRARALWVLPQHGSVDAFESVGGKLRVFGWDLVWSRDPAQTVQLRLGQGPWLDPVQMSVVPRPDVLAHYPEGVVDCGFSAMFEIDPQRLLNEAFEVRAVWRDGLGTTAISLGLHALDHLRNSLTT